MRSGTPFAHEVDFSTGLPTGAVVYSVLGNDGIPVSGYEGLSVTPPSGAFSMVLHVPALANISTKPLFELRTLVWSYPTVSGVISGRTRYRIERDIPFPATEDGVRSKLGVEAYEVEDKDIDLLLAYADLSTQADLSAYETSGDYQTLIVTNAIEAQAALNLLPSLQLAIAKAEDSGTNKYQRFNSIDWEALEAGLNRSIFRLQELLGTSTDNLTGAIFIAVGPSTDRVTNTEYV